MNILFLFELAVLIFSVIIHEISHGYVAERLGDPTARLAGRLTLNPLKHIDLVGSILLPLVLALSGQPIIGWAKPVPYNPYNLKNPVKGGALIAVAGPLSNLLVAAVFGLLIRWLTPMAMLQGSQILPVVQMFSLIVTLNLLLAIFNLLPIPPIDGSKAITYLLPLTWRFHFEAFWARLATLFAENLIVSLLLLFFLLPYILGFIFIILRPIVSFLYLIFVGQPSPFI